MTPKLTLIFLGEFYLELLLLHSHVRLHIHEVTNVTKCVVRLFHIPSSNINDTWHRAFLKQPIVYFSCRFD
jgi:hypothetical protein